MSNSAALSQWKNIVLTQYLLVAPTVSLCASVFVCDPLTPDGREDPAIAVHLSRADYSYACDTPKYLVVRLVGYIGAIFYAGAVPLFWMISLYLRRDEMKKFSNFQKYGFLYGECLFNRPYLVDYYALHQLTSSPSSASSCQYAISEKNSAR
jgi:hypothetical protein